MESDDVVEAVKNQVPQGPAKGIFTIKLSRNLPIPLLQTALWRLLFRSSAATSAPLSLKTRLQKHDERSAIHLSHARSHQDLPALQEGIG
jgi:hypothetical protein